MTVSALSFKTHSVLIVNVKGRFFCYLSRDRQVENIEDREDRDQNQIMAYHQYFS